MRLLLDTVAGHEIDSGIGVGQIIRTGLILDIDIPLFSTPTPTALIQALTVLGLPPKGEAYPAIGYEDWFCKRYILRAITSTTAVITIVYQFNGLMTTRDTSSLSSVPTQLFPGDFSPLYVSWTPPPIGGMAQTAVKKLLTLQTTLPLRHLIISKTVAFEAGPAVLDAFGGVNDADWQNLPVGYWLFSGIEGDTLDEGLTFTYTATFSTKQKEDWAQMGFMTDETGQAVTVPDADVQSLRNQDYFYGTDATVNGLLYAGMHPRVDFLSLFGI